MTAEKFKRKLTAILSADVRGYSRLMGADEEATVRTLQAYKEVMASSIQHHRGRIVGTAGDSVLAEFASVVDAVQCAVEIQQVLRAKNALLPEDRRMDFRIGINLGDVIEEGDSIYGDGVNIAARLESLAEAGGICISGSAYEQIENKLPLRYDYLGEHEVKNIAKPVRVYRARIEPEAAPSKLGKEKKPVGKRLSKAAFAIIAAVMIVGLVTLYQFALRPSPPKMEVASKEKMALPLPDVPSIAVLPFVNMSEDPKQEFLCDGMTEGIIAVLSKVPRLFVVARDSTFTYKGKPVKVKQVSEDLGVRYVLEGSVQRSGDRVRITAQLIDALTGHHLWAERYDRDLKDLFALQDDVTLKVLTAIRVKLTEGELSLGYGKYYGGKQGLDCYLKIMEGNDLVSRRNIKDNNLARRIAEEALAMCPEVPMAYLLMANVHSVDYWLGSTRSPRESVEKAIELVQKALALDDTLAEAHGFLGYLYTQKREYEKGIAEGERAVALNPGDSTVLVYYAMSLNFGGRSEEAITLLQKAIRLNPVGSYYNYLCNLHLGNALMMTGRFEEAVSAYKKVIQHTPNNIWGHMMLTATYSMMGREKEARAEAAEVLRINPKFSLDFFAKTSLIKEQSVRDNVFNALRKVGLK
jgi:adenylate cyclase